jgi:GNAT superfamily N-acetyltransferase
MMDIKIREFGEGDFEQLLSLFKEFSEFEKRPQLMVNNLERMIAEKDYFKGFAAVLPDGQLVGYATYNFVYYTWTGKSIYMDDLYVKPEFRGTGFGKELINSVIDFAKENNCEKVKWQVSHWNVKAKEFYRSLGAEISDNEQNCELKLN